MRQGGLEVGNGVCCGGTAVQRANFFNRKSEIVNAVGRIGCGQCGVPWRGSGSVGESHMRVMRFFACF